MSDEEIIKSIYYELKALKSAYEVKEATDKFYELAGKLRVEVPKRIDYNQRILLNSLDAKLMELTALLLIQANQLSESEDADFFGRLILNSINKPYKKAEDGMYI